MDSVIQMVIEDLIAAGFAARRARPGMRMPRILTCCEMVGLHRLTARPGGKLEAELFIQVLGPTQAGAEACENEAMAVAAAIAQGTEHIPARLCSGEECGYDRAGDFFSQRLLFSLPVRLGGSGAQTEMPGVILEGATVIATVEKWSVTVKRTAEAVYTFGENAPVGISSGRVQYELELEGIQLNQGRGELEQELPETFSLSVFLGDRPVIYSGCRWRELSQKESGNGITLQAKAVALSRSEG